MIIDGRAIAQDLNIETAAQVEQLSFKPLLVDVLIGDDPASLSYVKIKQRKAEACGFDFELVQVSPELTTEQVIEQITNITKNANLSGLLVQLPLPAQFNEAKILESIPFELDVDVLSEQSRQNFYAGKSNMYPPTAEAIMHILNSLSTDLAKLQFLVLGQGELVGKPVSYLLEKASYNVWRADSNTNNTDELLKQADCIISGVGKSGFIIGDNIKQGCIVIDAGTSEANGSIAGDVDFESASQKASYITPVPGGVGPVTVAQLLRNVLAVAARKN